MKINEYLAIIGLLVTTTVCLDPLPNHPSLIWPPECETEECKCCLTKSCSTCSGICIQGIFGKKCRNKCPERCISCRDFGLTNELYWHYGFCTECKPGYYSTLEYFQCNYVCPEGCVTCQSATQCHSCRKSFYIAQFSQDHSECKPCPVQCEICTSEVNCTSCTIPYVTGSACTECITGRYGEFCNETCPINCMNDVCERYSGNCTDCIKGKHGQNCDMDCPLSCKDSECRQENGLCSHGCVDNFSGPTCEDCTANKYGKDCTKDCPKHCAEYTCHRDLGVCHDCQTNFYGPKCQDCVIGRHGSDCSLLCPPFCRLKICERQDGKCLSCEGIKYGPFCNMSCSSNCNDTSCDKRGLCNTGCKSGYSGDRCCLYGNNCDECSSNDTCSKCKVGMFGEHCESDCPVNCEDRLCNKIDGTCQRTSEPVQAGAIVGASFGSLLTVTGIALWIYFLWRKGWKENMSYIKHNNGNIDDRENGDTKDIREHTPKEVYLEMKHIQTEINILKGDNATLADSKTEYEDMSGGHSTTQEEIISEHAYESMNLHTNTTTESGLPDPLYYENN